MSDLLSAILSFEKSQDHLQEQVRLVRGRLGLPNGQVTTNRTGYHWVRLFEFNNMPVQAFNNKTAATPNLDVYVAVDPYRRDGMAPYVVLGTTAGVGTSMGALLDEKSLVEEIVGGHASAHEWSESNLGRDALNVFERAIVPLRVQALPEGAMQVYVGPGYYLFGGDIILYPGGLTEEIEPPAEGSRLDLVVLDCSDNTVRIETGTAAISVYDPLAPPALPVDCLPLAYVMVGSETTAINEQHIFDMRPFLSYAGPLADHAHDGVAGSGGLLDPTAALDASDGSVGQILSVASGGRFKFDNVFTSHGFASASDTITTNSTNYGDVGSLSVVVSLGRACKVIALVTMPVRNGNAGNASYLCLTDGSNNLLGQETYVHQQVANYYAQMATMYLGNHATGSLTVKARWKVSGGTSTAQARSLLVLAF